VAVPAALIAGVVAFAALGGLDRSPAPAPSTPGPEPSLVVSLGPQAATACQALVDALPATTGSGQPPVVLSCGGTPFSAPATASTDREEGFYVLSGVCWYAEKSPEGSTWSTMDRQVPVSVFVPVAYPAPAQLVIAFSDEIIATVPAVTEPPAACR
jgi:hypothetical protein